MVGTTTIGRVHRWVRGTARHPVVGWSVAGPGICWWAGAPLRRWRRVGRQVRWWWCHLCGAGGGG